ncbi:ABC transporter ATP-binding protein/permease [Cohnella rhizosphaerae]|uniref:ABC transporter ATP-binding protein/permease n=1 Tax=Cohnella rhizosphaerae TaxID=1457232 RepID=A0A9X4KS28_9BACL|nr:ABC transporter ATP-binding protein [Cohnella rhizosphaerae]MDG0809658.1 ABC transporter ATP-binding protein/permease [Cohnella rhizosphaerae]
MLLLTPEFYAPVRAVGTQFHASAAGMSAIKRIVELLGMAGAGWPERADGKELPPMRKAGRTIELRGVSVRYPGAARDAVSGLSLTIRPGQRVAVIGPTGAGKSTLLDLLQGFVRPTAGAVYIDGVDMAELSMASWREELSGVPQQPKLFPGTVRDNVAYGRPGATEAEVLRALELSGAADVLAALPQGLDTVIGESARLSGGQQQRLAIARALLKDAPLLLFDEPTAGLDAIREAELRRTLDTLLRGRMSVTVAHRLETVQGADLVVVLADGKLAEIGTPAQLLASDGLYARLSAASSSEEKPALSAVRQAAVRRE